MPLQHMTLLLLLHMGSSNTSWPLCCCQLAQCPTHMQCNNRSGRQTQQQQQQQVL
jgi:hypothetical protein